MSKEGTIHLTYWREYKDPEDRYDPWFKSHNTIFRNVPLSQLTRLNSKELKEKVKAFCDKNYKETASNFTGDSGVDMIVGSEYYYTYGQEFKLDKEDRDYNIFLNDYGQKWNGRQFFKYDFKPEMMKGYQHD
tara:strand:- start:868 stop:1263 length:396 start_codon:yes stop_codon:yes gene_type:complete